ncbi:NDR1/HIN1-like protein 3 [Gastrolobium bilobum]|uniref:NDR1/HIN1-like protein 3 n=1 Tax=Gastrolobium bilobum TaxID=150636 RepID=UPI002AAFE0D2|nr:NDR1/HIN1-like protein 3 [Gastrolobium bilobum]
MRCRFHFNFGCIFWTPYALSFISIIFVIFFFIIIAPSNLNFYVTEASLTQFNLNNNTTLYYNFKLNITVRNPNNNVIVYYRVMRASVWYKHNYFANNISLAPFDQGKKKTSFLQTTMFDGNKVFNLKPKQLGEYNEETRVGIYNDLDVDLDFEVIFKYVGMFKSKSFNPPTVQCRQLSVPLISNGKSASPFNVTKCSTPYFFTYRNL